MNSIFSSNKTRQCLITLYVKSFLKTYFGFKWTNSILWTKKQLRDRNCFVQKFVNKLKRKTNIRDGMYDRIKTHIRDVTELMSYQRSKLSINDLRMKNGPGQNPLNDCL